MGVSAEATFGGFTNRVCRDAEAGAGVRLP